jgi:cathepsin A (carboxypeptidase C)
MLSDYVYIKSFEKFYFVLTLSRSQPDKDPLIIWLQGGPGCSSLFGMFMENGPYFYKYNPKSKTQYTFEHNPYAWNNNANVLYLDQPLGTGFSVSEDKLGRRMNGEEFTIDFYNFLQGFLKQYPEFKKRPLYLMGESYAGHYIPSFAQFIS